MVLYQSYSGRIIVPLRMTGLLSAAHTHPVHHGVLVRGERGQGVAVVRLTEQLQHRLSPGLLTSSAHCARTRFRPKIKNSVFTRQINEACNLPQVV